MPFIPDKPKSGFIPDNTQPSASVNQTVASQKNPFQIANDQEEMLAKLKAPIKDLAAKVDAQVGPEGISQLIGASMGPMFMKGAAGAGTALGRIGIGSLQGAAQSAPDSRLEGALGGAAVAGIPEVARALPSTLKTAFRSIIPESAETYQTKVSDLIRGKEGVLDGDNLPAEAIRRIQQDSTDKGLRGRASSALKNIEPAIRDTIESKANELRGHEVMGKLLGHSVLATALLHRPEALLTAPALGAATGGGLELARKLSQKSTPMINPQSLGAILKSIQETQKDSSVK